MSIASYAELKTAVANWLNRDDLLSIIPDFVFFGENALYKALRAIENEKSTGGSMSTDSVALPSDYMEASLLVFDGGPLERISTQRYHTLKHLGHDTGITKCWARDQSNIRVLPYDGGTHEYELVYWSSLAHLSDTNTVNHLLTSNPELFLYYALIEASVFLHDKAGTEKWSAMAKRAVDGLNQRWYDENISGSTQSVSEIGGGYGS